MASLWAWSVVVFSWSLFLSILFAKLDMDWMMVVFFCICVASVVAMVNDLFLDYALMGCPNSILMG